MDSRNFILDKPELLPRFAAFLSKQALPLDVQVKPYVPARTNQQNKRLWALHTLAVTLVGIVLRRLFRTNDLLFRKYDALRLDVDRLKLAMVAVDPSKTALFEAFMSRPGDG